LLPAIYDGDGWAGLGAALIAVFLGAINVLFLFLRIVFITVRHSSYAKWSSIWIPYGLGLTVLLLFFSL